MRISARRGTCISWRTGDGVLYALGHEVKRAVEVNPSEFPAKSRLGKMLGSLAGQVENARRKWVADASHG